MKTVLAGDIGGTKSNLALYNWELGAGQGLPGGAPIVPPAPILQRQFSSQKADGLVEIANAICNEAGVCPDVACFGIAGPVIGQHVKAPNIPWEVDARELREKLNLQKVLLLNDLEAAACGVACLAPAQLRTLQAGKPHAGGSLAVIAAGTGLGEGMLVNAAGRRIALASEGGHADFAPVDDEQIELFKFIRETIPRVSYESILAGPGIVKCYEYCARTSRAVAADSKARFEGATDRAAAVTELAALGDPVACRSLQLFARVYGAEAGNMALRNLCYGGLFVAGGIAPKILPFLEDGNFMNAFLAKGRMARLMPEFPVHVVLEPAMPLYGAAAMGATL